MKQYILLPLFLFMTGVSFGQREYAITKFDEAPTIDGVLNEEVWNKTDVANSFTVNSPVFGEISEFESEVRMYYDDNAIYIGGNLYDPEPDSVSYTLSQRDDVGNADWFGVSIDPYANNVNAFAFRVTAAGVEIDGLESTSGMDESWNAVWRSAVARQEFGWSFEMKIPYSAIRFPNKNVQDWHINFWRSVRRNRETSHWNPIDPNEFGNITQSGDMKGIQGVQSPLRLSLTPYATGYIENSYDSELGKQTWKSRLTGGLDLKYGLNDAFTLDMTLIPDFGQTTSDKQILNLGPFEVRYNENRPFFIEGTELFKIGGVFYSRRIGGRPFNYRKANSSLEDDETIVSNSAEAPLINGTKVSGRTKLGLGIGVFNSVEGRTEATIVDALGNERKVQTNPLTNYNVFVLSQNLKNNSVVSFVNTNVMREGANRDANVSVVDMSLYTPDGQYRVTTKLAHSILFEEEVTSGHNIGARFAKVAGRWQYNIGYWEESDTYDPNDLGFLYANNERGYSANLSWNDYKGSKRFFRRNASIGWSYVELYKPQLYQANAFNWHIGGLHKKQLYTRLSGSTRPFGQVDHFESRQFGKVVRFNPNADISWFFTSDYSKRFALDGRFWVKNFFNTTQHNKGMYISPRLRISDQLNLIIDANLSFFEDDYGYVSPFDDAYDDKILLGVRDRVVVENSIRSQFVFTKRMGVDLRLRHYWQQVNYEHFMELLDDGDTKLSDYNPVDVDGKSDHSTNYNAFTVDINYRWIFIPGSELRIVYKNNLFHSKSDLDANYFNTFESLFDQPQINSISMKLLVFLDAMYLKRKKKQ
jgi:hypothetical protein